MGTIRISNKPQNVDYFKLAQKAEAISKRIKNENEIRAHWLNEEFEKLEDKVHELEIHLDHLDSRDTSLTLGKKNLQSLIRIMRDIDSAFIEIDYLDESNKKIALTDIEDQVKDLKKQFKFLEESYIVH